MQNSERIMNFLWKKFVDRTKKYFYLIWLLKITLASVNSFPNVLNYIDIILYWILFIIIINNIKVAIITMIHLKQQTY